MLLSSLLKKFIKSLNGTSITKLHPLSGYSSGIITMKEIRKEIEGNDISFEVILEP